MAAIYKWHFQTHSIQLLQLDFLLLFVSSGLINIELKLVELLDWRPSLVRHICTSKPQWGMCHVLSNCISSIQLFSANFRQKGRFVFFSGHTRRIYTNMWHMQLTRCVKPPAAVCDYHYLKVSNIRRPKYQHLNDFRLILQLSAPNPVKPSVKSIMKM